MNMRPQLRGLSLLILVALCVCFTARTVHASTLSPGGASVVADAASSTYLSGATLKDTIPTITFAQSANTPTWTATLDEKVYVKGDDTIFALTLKNSLSSNDSIGSVVLHGFLGKGYTAQLYYASSSSTTPSGQLTNPGTLTLSNSGLEAGQSFTAYIDYKNVNYASHNASGATVSDNYSVNGSSTAHYDVAVPTPEPATMLAAGIAGLPLLAGAAWRRWRKKASA